MRGELISRAHRAIRDTGALGGMFTQCRESPSRTLATELIRSRCVSNQLRGSGTTGPAYQTTGRGSRSRGRSRAHRSDFRRLLRGPESLPPQAAPSSQEKRHPGLFFGASRGALALRAPASFCPTTRKCTGRARGARMAGGERGLYWSWLRPDYGQDTGLGPNDSLPLFTCWTVGQPTAQEAADEPLPNSVSHTDRSLIPTEPLQS